MPLRSEFKAMASRFTIMILMASFTQTQGTREGHSSYLVDLRQSIHPQQSPQCENMHACSQLALVKLSYYYVVVIATTSAFIRMVYVAINSNVVDNKCCIPTGMKNACYLTLCYNQLTVSKTIKNERHAFSYRL